MTSRLLSVTVQKQPVGLVLDHTNIGKQQLIWLLPRSGPPPPPPPITGYLAVVFVLLFFYLLGNL
jgi:hypothetical protein